MRIKNDEELAICREQRKKFYQMLQEAQADRRHHLPPFYRNPELHRRFEKVLFAAIADLDADIHDYEQNGR